MEEKKEVNQEIKAEELIKEVEKEMPVVEKKVGKKLNENKTEEKFREILKRTSFGTKLREAIERIADGESGALIVLSEPGQIRKITLGGFKVNCKFTSERLVELAKMDGAIIIDPQLNKIHYANILLIPNPEILSRETGTRHQAAERTSKQTGQLVITVSERTKLTTLYYGNIKYTLKSMGTLITRLQSTLDTLDEQKKIFNNLTNYLNILEFTDLTTAIHVVSVIQKAELISRGNKIARRYLNELMELRAECWN